MGYTTQFEGTLLFTEELIDAQKGALYDIFGEDTRDHPEWKVDRNSYMSYVDLEFNRDYTGMQWDGSEKTYEMTELVNLVLRLMREKWPNFGVKGEMLAQGEEIGDVWTLKINEAGNAETVKAVFNGRRVTCPCCDHTFEVSAE